MQRIQKYILVNDRFDLVGKQIIFFERIFEKMFFNILYLVFVFCGVMIIVKVYFEISYGKKILFLECKYYKVLDFCVCFCN